MRRVLSILVIGKDLLFTVYRLNHISSLRNQMLLIGCFGRHGLADFKQILLNLNTFYHSKVKHLGKTNLN